jgi:hypothetical protein
MDLKSAEVAATWWGEIKRGDIRRTQLQNVTPRIEVQPMSSECTGTQLASSSGDRIQSTSSHVIAPRVSWPSSTWKKPLFCPMLCAYTEMGANRQVGGALQNLTLHSIRCTCKGAK